MDFDRKPLFDTAELKAKIAIVRITRLTLGEAAARKIWDDAGLPELLGEDRSKRK